MALSYPFQYLGYVLDDHKAVRLNNMGNISNCLSEGPMLLQIKLDIASQSGRKTLYACSAQSDGEFQKPTMSCEDTRADCHCTEAIITLITLQKIAHAILIDKKSTLETI